MPRIKRNAFLMSKIRVAVFISLLSAGTGALPAATNNLPPDLAQVRELIKAHLPGVTDAELDHHALDGLLQGLRGKVRLVDSATAEGAARTNIAKHILLEGSIAYLRFEQIAPGLPAEVKALCQGMNKTN